MSSFSSTCHLLKLNIITAFQERKKKYRNGKGYTDFNVPKTDCSR
jgi:hypothetical protein